MLKNAGTFPFHIAQCYEKLNKNESALKYYIKSTFIWKEKFGKDYEDVVIATQNAKRLAKKIGKESELPNWMI